ncbi:Prephenate dehydratase [Rhodospirillaceae bacterium LM-1]|nr:Prephenate dehydratase [Rhodospirillaceae bacterium LM-1]
MPISEAKRIAFQGIPGAYSNLACRIVYPKLEPVPCETFDDVFACVRDGKAELAMIPIENSVAGRVADIHHLLPDSGLHIIGEYFLRVNHQLLGVKGAKVEDIKTVRSHVHALGQCRKLIKQLGIKAVVAADTALAANEVAERGDKSVAAIASELAGETYGLDVLRSNIEDAEHNTTRFVIMARQPIAPDRRVGPVITTFVFKVRNVPAALYKALGGFATNAVNMTKLESYQVGGQFVATLFYVDVEGHPDDKGLRLALEELDFFTREVKIIGVYPAHPFRFENRLKAVEE